MRTIVSPSFPIELRDVYDFLGEFGPYNGRYVPQFPKDWLTQLIAHVKDVGLPVERSALLQKLSEQLSQCMYPVSWSWDSSKSWGENVVAATNCNENDIIAGDALDPTPFKAWWEIAGYIKETRSRTLDFSGSMSSFVELCKPLLLNAPAVYLVDPYFDIFKKEHEHLLRSFFKQSAGSSCYSIEVITRQSACGGRQTDNVESWISVEEIDQNLRKIYASIVPKGRNFRLHLVHKPKKGKGDLKLHDRFFLTKWGAINFGHGFNMSRVNSRQNAFVVDKAHHETLKEIYMNGVARFQEHLPKRASIPYPSDVTTLSVLG